MAVPSNPISPFPKMLPDHALALADSCDASLDAALAAVEGKSGAVLGLFAELAALLAGAPADAVGAYAALGRAVGVASQIRADLYDLLGASVSKDLANGTRTLPLALYLDGLDTEQRTPFLLLLDKARTDECARKHVRESLRASGVVRACAVIVEAELECARDALEGAGITQPAGDAIRLLIDSVSFVRRPAESEARLR